MRKLFVLLIIWLFTLPLLSQEYQFKAPDYEWIKKEMKNKNSDYYYPQLLERYNNGDTNLTIEEGRVLYYGSFFTGDYSSYASSEYIDSLKAYFNKDSILKEDYKEIIRLEKIVLKEFPFNMRDLNTLIYAYAISGDTASAIRTDYMLNLVIETILSTGDGATEASAWHVISVSHEYDLLNILGFQFGGNQSLTDSGCDYLTVKENQYKIEGFYFDVGMMIKMQSEIFE